MNQLSNARLRTLLNSHSRNSTSRGEISARRASRQPTLEVSRVARRRTSRLARGLVSHSRPAASHQVRCDLASCIMPRTTLDLDFSVLRELRRRGDQEGKSMGRVASELLAVAL